MVTKLISNRPSRSAARLRRGLGLRRSIIPGQHIDTIINWGNSSLAHTADRIINDPNLVGIATNKLEFFRRMSTTEVRIPPWTTEKGVVQDWLNNGRRVVARTRLTGHSGDGIVIINPGDDIPDARLYTKFIRKSQEFRVHIFNGEVIDVQRKTIPNGMDKETINWDVRSHSNGFIFVRSGMDCPRDCTSQALAAMQQIGLDFGAVDVIYLSSRDKGYVLEINSAPGIESDILFDNYIRSFNRIL